MLKQANLSFSVAAQSFGDDVTSIQFSTQDRNTAKLIFTIREGKQPLDLTDAEGIVDLVMGDKSIFEDNKATVTAPLDGKLEYTITADQIRHPGRARGELQLIGKDGQSIGGFRFNFTIKKALVDEYTGPVKEYYINDLEAVKEEVRKKADTTASEMDTLIADIEATAESIKDFDVVRVDMELREKATKQEVQEVTTRLVDTSNFARDRINSAVIQKGLRKPAMVVVDDDIVGTVWTVLKPLVDELKFKLTCAVITGKVGIRESLTLEQMYALRNSGLVEFVSHTETHPYLAQISEEQQIQEMKNSKDWLRQHGFVDDILVYPYGSQNETVRKNAKKFYRAAIDIDNGQSKINYPPVTSYKMERVSINRGVNLSKQKIDEAIANNGLFILMTHCWEEAFNINDLRQIVLYAREKGLDIITLSDAMDRFGNVVEVGDSVRLGLAGTRVMDADGNEHGAESNKLVTRSLIHGFDVKNDTPPSYFPIDKTTVVLISDSTDTRGFPTGKQGVLITHVRGTGTSYPYTTQEFEVINDINAHSNNNRKYRRYWNTATRAWSPWKKTGDNFVYEPGNTFKGSDLLSAFEANSTTITRVTSGNASGFPNSAAGTLITHNIDNGYGYQTYKIYNTEAMYERHSKADGTWGSWQTQAKGYTTAERDAYNGSTSLSSFPNGVITNIVTTNYENMPEAKAGTLTTYKLDSAYARQEYRIHQSNAIYGRYINASSYWSAWEKISAI